MIDWWLLVCMNILVLTLCFHTYLAHTVYKAKNKPISLSGSTFFVRKVTPAKNDDRKNETIDENPRWLSEQLIKNGIRQ